MPEAPAGADNATAIAPKNDTPSQPNDKGATCEHGTKQGAKCDSCGPVAVYYDPPLGGAQSFDDADVFVGAREQQYTIQTLQHRLEQIIGNVMRDEELDAAEKAARIQDAAADFGARVRQVADGNYAEMMAAIGLKDDKESSGPSVLQRILGFVAGKATWTAAYQNKLPDSAFAYIESGGQKDADGKTTPRSKRHFPHHDAEGKLDMPHLRNAMSRMMQSPHGPKAKAHLQAHAKSAGVGGKDDDEPEGLSAFRALKAQDGSWRWVALFSNRFRDKDGEYFTEQAHKDFERYVDESGKYPELWGWHTPGSAAGKADTVTYVDDFMFASGYFYPGFEDVAERLSQRKDLGVSHGFEHWKPDGDDTYEGYRSFEISFLPRDKAANPWTAFTADMVKEVMMGFTPQKRTALVETYGEDRVAKMEEGIGNLSKGLRDRGVDFKGLIDAWQEAKDGEEGTGAAGEAAPGTATPSTATPDPAAPADGTAAAPAGAESDKPADAPADADTPEAKMAKAIGDAVAAAVTPLRTEIAALTQAVTGTGKDDKPGDAPRAAARMGGPGAKGGESISEDLVTMILGKETVDAAKGEESPAESPATPFVQDLIRVGSHGAMSNGDNQS